MQPILVLVDRNAPNRFSSYILEILATEGVCCRDTVDLALQPLDARVLAGRELVIVADIPLTGAHRERLTEYVSGGGNLIALRPPPEMGALFGLKPARGMTRLMSEGYVTFSPDHPLTNRLAASSLQFHGDADLFEPEDARVLGWLSAKLGVRTRYPAIVLHERGRGRTAAFTFDLAASTVLFHQGLRANAHDGANPDPDRDRAYKPNDLFYKYLDERLKEVPQADVHQDLLIRLIEHMGGDAAPLPRLWHFPDAAPAVALIDGDSDSMTSEDLDRIVEIVESVEGKFSLFLMTDDFAALEPDKMQALRKRGHDFGPHYFAGRMPTAEDTRSNMRQETEAYQARYAYAPVAHRGHNCIWVGWTEHARYLRENGIRLDTNFCPGPGFQSGYLNGSGLPVKFMDEQGNVLDVYEQSTVSTEDGWFSDKCFLPAMSLDEAVEHAKRQIDEAAGRYHGVYHPYYHPCSSRTRPETVSWFEATCRHVRERGLPFVSAREWVEFNDARRTVDVQGVSWDASDGRLSFRLAARQPLAALTILLPAEHDGRKAISDSVAGAERARIVSLEGRDQLALVLDLEPETAREIRVRYG